METTIPTANAIYAALSDVTLSDAALAARHRMRLTGADGLDWPALLRIAQGVHCAVADGAVASPIKEQVEALRGRQVAQLLAGLYRRGCRVQADVPAQLAQMLAGLA